MYQIQEKNKPKNREIQAGQRSTIHGSTLFRPKAGVSFASNAIQREPRGSEAKGIGPRIEKGR